MDDSQSSYVFSGSTSMISCSSSPVIIDAMAYDSFLQNTKASLSSRDLINGITFSCNFSRLLEDCRLCISRSLDFAMSLLLDAEMQLSKLTEYMENAACLLHLLSSHIKSVVESISLSCTSFKKFPTTTGSILLLVFTHCKNSQTTYGLHLSNVQKQLKDLFRTCHELQLTYLMVLDKQFIFDLTDEEELNILIEALNINLKIGAVVQSLDVKTTAEQWKAYTALCDKYSSNLLDQQIYQECTQLLCDMARNNLKNAVELGQEDKVVVRSLKVTNFTIKILLKISNTFKHATVKDFTQVMDLLIYVFLHNPAYLESIEGRPKQFINGMIINVCTPSDLLLKELIMDEKFLNVVFTYEVKNLEDEKLLGYACLLVGIIKCSLQKSELMPSFPKHKLLHCVFRLLSRCQVWLNMGLRFQNESIKSEQTIGLFEHMLIFAASLAVTMDGEEMYHLEKIMYETILGTETITAMFVSNLWAVLARIGNNRSMLFSQMVSLCQIYQKLENHKTFLYSPQKIHISYTMRALFEAMRVDDRNKIFDQFNPMNGKNASLWSVLKIKNLNRDLQRNVQEFILERYKKLSTCLPPEIIDELINTMKLASSCSYSAVDAVNECVVQAWKKGCPSNCTILTNTLDSGTLWYFEYTEALVSWTWALDNSFYDNTQNLTEVLHVVTKIIKIHNPDLNLLLIDLLCKLATFTLHGQNKHIAASLVADSYRMLAQDSNSIVRNKFFSVVSTCDNKRLEQIMHSALGKELQDAWNDYVKYKTVKAIGSPTKLKESLLVADGLEFNHKCIEARLEIEDNSETVDNLPRSCSSNFEFANLDTLFDHESDAEPASKKLKMDNGEAESILKRLETEAALLTNMKENVFKSEHKKRIQDVCEKLKSIVS